MQGGSQFREELQRHHLPSYMVNLSLRLIHMWCRACILHINLRLYFDEE